MSAPRASLSFHRWTLHLRRKTTTGHWLPEIDGLRFIAIASVLLFHMQGQLEHHYSLDVPHTVFARALGSGNRGVPLFFVLSGFILSLPFARSRLFSAPAPSLRNYYLRRVTRLEPPYLLNLVLVAAGAALFDHQAWSALLPHLLASAAYLHYAIYGTPSSINSVAWSLEVEVQFYLLAPLLAAVFVLRRALLRRALLAAGIVASASLQLVFHLSQFTLAGDLEYFLAGLLLADLYLRHANTSQTLSPLQSHAWDLAAVSGWPTFFLLPDRLTSLWLPPLALLLCLAAFRGDLTRRLLRTPAVAITGGMCYTIYLWHAPVLTAVDRALRHFPALTRLGYSELFLLEAAVKSAAVALICLPLFALVERPCMDPHWPAKLAARLRKARARVSSPASQPGLSQRLR
jgi:peptidoglycan/LPS O-acetylase OafA/YrhL